MNFDTHLIFDIFTGIVTVGWLIVGLLIKNSLAEIKVSQIRDKQDLIDNQVKVKEELFKQQTTTAMTIEVHMAQDEEKFKSIDRALNKIEVKLDKLVDRPNIVVQNNPPK